MRSLYAAGAICALIFAGPALAKSTAQERITQHTIEAKTLEDRDVGKAFSRELGTLRAWIGEAQAYLAQDEKSPARRALDRVAAQIALIGALMDRADADAAARAAHAEADALERALAETLNAAQALEKRQTELEGAGL